MDIDETLRKLKPVIGNKADKLYLLYQTEEEPKKKRELEGLIKLLAAEFLKETFDKKLLLSLPKKEEICGKYTLGKVFYNSKEQHEFGLKEEEMIRHIGVFGMSGSGKTTIAYSLIKELAKNSKPLLIFDWKRNYRYLLEEYDDMLLFTVGRNLSPFLFNPLIPPKETQSTVWLNKLIDVMSHAYFLGHGVAHILQKAFYAVYRSQKYPTFEDVRDWLYSYKVSGREAGWMDSTKRAVEALCFGDVGKVFNTRSPNPLEDILKRNVCLELDALRNSEKTFFIEAMLLWIHHYRMQEEKRSSFKHAIIIEEAHHVLHRKKQEVEGEESVTDIILREIRELGESLIILDQHPSLISLPALGNTYCTIAMNLKTWADVKAVSDAILLEPKQRKFLGELDVGEGIVKLSGRYPKPFLVKFPKQKIEYMPDKEVLRKMSRYYDERQENKEELPKRRSIPEVQRGLKEEGKHKNLEREEEEFIKDIAEYPISPVVERYERLGLSASKGTKIQKELIKKDFIKASRVGKPEGGSIKYLELKEKAIDALEKGGRKIESSLSKRHGGPAHTYWVHKMAEYLRQRGYDVEKEKAIGDGKTVDISGIKGNKSIAIEVETGKSKHVVSNVKKCLSANFDRIISLALSRQVKSKIEKKLKESGILDKVEVVCVKEIFGKN